MYRTPIYTEMKGIWLWEGMKFFPILNTTWKYAIVHKLKPPTPLYLKVIRFDPVT